MSSTALAIYTGGAAGAAAAAASASPAPAPAPAPHCSLVGLSNQGATCYMNSLLQTLFMTPEFRAALYTWEYDEARDGGRERCIALQLQRLFGLLQLGAMRAIDTVALTKSFGWEVRSYKLGYYSTDRIGYDRIG
jgi:hypothetical protein